MRILVDSCSYNCQNVGDLAMLTVAVTRLRELWPEASIQVITNAPALVARHCASGRIGTVPVRGRRLLLEERLLGPLQRALPAGLRRRWVRREDRLKLAAPRLVARSLRIKQRFTGRDAADLTTFLNAIDRADLVVVNGAGILTDAFKESALGILATLDLASRRGIPCALFGQGLGPIDDPDLRRRAAEVLPRVRLIAIRESRSSEPLLGALGVSPSSVMVTGDDAIELAFAALRRRRDEAGSGGSIGVNVRVAPYADVERGMLASLREALVTAATTHNARMLPIPIAHHGGGMDVDTLRALLTDAGDGGAGLETPQQVIHRIGECRVMVTGSYHGAVFALAQGIPVVALARSTYYVNKMAGVAEQFGVGCEIVRLDANGDGDAPGLSERIGAAIDRAWADADRVRAPLLSAAVDQIQRGRSAYVRLFDSLQAGTPGAAAPAR